MLESFNIEPASEIVYLTMLRDRLRGLDEIAGRLGWAREKVRGALDDLATLSLLRPSWENPKLLLPVLPEVGLEIMLARQREELLRRQHQLEQSRAAIETLVAESHADADVGAAKFRVEELIGLDAVREALERIAYETRHELLAFAPDGAQTAEALSASRPLNRRLLEQGVQMRTIYQTSARNDQPTTAHAHWLVEMGAQVRTAPVLPVRMLVVDRKFTMVPIDPARTSEGACILRGAGSVAVARALFERHWQDASPWGQRTDPSAGGPTALERALLRLLFDGNTDEQAGRKLGVSTRTVGRMTSELMTRLGARSRFQAGALAAGQGWLEP